MPRLTAREEEILKILHNEPMISQEELANRLELTRSAAAVHISNLIKKGFILGRGYVFNQQKKVVVIGGANYDIKGIVVSDKVEMLTSNVGKIVTSVGGVGRNIAENLARLNVPTSLLSAVGRDKHGRAIIEYSKEAGVDMSQILQTGKHNSGTYMAFLNDKNDLQVGLADMNIIDVIDTQYIESNLSLLKNAGIIVCDTNLRKDTIEYIAHQANELNCTLVVEPVSVEKARKVKDILSYIDIITPNKEELEEICQMQLNSFEDYKRAGDMLLSQGVRIVLLKLGEKGLFLYSDDSAEMIPSMADEIVDVTGGGDSLVGGFLAAYYKGIPLQQCAKIASICAALTLQCKDTVSPKLSWEKLKKELKEDLTK
ncbi:PfkB family carbohydrate kinase [Proteinivorax tanatarense]|uniref:PfkB family carbohydrate kinase n=1 Tax=Proteinivorax tanatarense TaxID=1260629 RepID=A0AAU7VNJ0_9FIRM